MKFTILFSILCFILIKAHHFPNRAEYYKLESDCKNNETRSAPEEARDCFTRSSYRRFKCCFVSDGEKNYCMRTKKGNKTDENELMAVVARLGGDHATITCDSKFISFSLFITLLLYFIF